MTNKVGRPFLESKRTTLAVRVTPKVKAWIAAQKDSQGAVIERLVHEQMLKEEGKWKTM